MPPYMSLSLPLREPAAVEYVRLLVPMQAWQALEDRARKWVWVPEADDAHDQNLPLQERPRHALRAVAGLLQHTLRQTTLTPTAALRHIVDLRGM